MRRLSVVVLGGAGVVPQLKRRLLVVVVGGCGCGCGGASAAAAAAAGLSAAEATGAGGGGGAAVCEGVERTAATAERVGCCVVCTAVCSIPLLLCAYVRLLLRLLLLF